uniref:hypothetical protein n=1 Tax=Ruminococcus bicirculans (ex Wegman et al. 2014) TaxID=1160721 RepID=UPI003FEEAADB
MFKMMPGFPREKIDIIKQSGQTFNQIDALIGDSTALIEDITIVIEENDYIVRILPNGLVENYIVTDNGYCGGSGHGIPPHYQVKMKKIVKIPTNHKNDLEDRSIINPMKEQLINLVDDIPRIEARFRHFSPPKGLIIPECDFIYDDPEFINWLEKVKYVLQDIYDKSNDKYIWNLINSTGIIHKFDGKSTNERELFNKLKSALNIIERNLDKYYHESSTKGDLIMKKPMLFISHASADIKYVQPLVELFADIGLNNDTMFCSSVPDYHIPMDNDIYDYLKRLFDNYDLHVFFVLSDNYYKSAACLNEMGASWVLQKRYSTILLPNFDFSAIDGAVNPYQISLKLGSDNIDELKTRLGELKDIISKEFNISVPLNRWEKKRDTFISTVKSIMAEGD